MADEEIKAGGAQLPVEPDESSLKGKGWDILAGGRENAETHGGEDPFNLSGDLVGFSAAQEVEQILPSPTDPASAAPATEAFWDRGRGAGEGSPPAETEDAIEAPPRELTPEELGSLPLSEPVVAAQAAPVVIELRALADEASEPTSPEPVMLAEPEPGGVMDTPEPIRLDEPEPSSGPMDSPAPAFSGAMDSPAPVLLDEAEPVGVVEPAPSGLPAFDDAIPVPRPPSLPEVEPWTAATESTSTPGGSRPPAQPVRFDEISSTGVFTEGAAAASPSRRAASAGSPSSGARKVVTAQSVLVDPFVTSMSRDLRTLLSDESAKDDLPANERLRKLLVTDESIKALWEAINQTYDEVVGAVRGSFSATEEMLSDLQRARMLLLADEANYDNAEQILRNVQARLRREEKVRTWARTRGTWLAIYLIGWMFLLAGLFAFNNGVEALLLRVVPEWMAYIYLPSLFGGMGGVIGALWVLIKHTAQKRDFDPIHTNWYVTNPFMGLALGMIAYLIVLTGGNAFNFITGAGQVTDFGNINPIIYPICLIVGFNQNLLWRLIDQFIKSITPDDPESKDQKPPTSSPEPGSGGD